MAKIRAQDGYHDGFEDGLEPVRSLDLQQVHSFSDLLEASAASSFGARRLGKAFGVLRTMVEDPDCFVVLTLSGAMTVAKMGLLICEMIERGYVNLIVSTGALQAHGMIENRGMTHFKYDPRMDDAELFNKGYDRVYDTLELERNLDQLELLVRKILDGIPGGEPIGSQGICEQLGAYLSEHFPDERAILKAAYEHQVPVIIPAFTDSELGLDVATNNWARRRAGKVPIHFDPFIDLDYYAEQVLAQKRLGIFTIGGGVPRNWAQQVAPYLELRANRLGDSDAETRRFMYGVRICPDSEHWGGLSGCTYSEGISWGKFIPEADGGRYAEVLCDATLVWPLLVRALIEKTPQAPNLSTRPVG